MSRTLSKNGANLSMDPKGGGFRRVSNLVEDGRIDAVAQSIEAENSSNQYACWETVDPEKWVPEGYTVVRVDSRGAGRSPGKLAVFSPREIKDYYDCIEWAGVQPWSSGKVGLCGISYYATNQWLVAEMHPPHLAAIVPWEGKNDLYRELTYHGRIWSGRAAGTRGLAGSGEEAS